MAKLTEKLAGARFSGPRTAAWRDRRAGTLDVAASRFLARRPPFIPAKTVGSFVPRLTQKAFEKYGFSAATLLTDWATIVGADIAGFTAPERLKWPVKPGARDEVAEGAEGRPGATLVLRVEPARALDVEYRGRQIVERINAYFGYRAVAQLRLVQGPLTAERSAPPAEVAAPRGVDAAPASDPLASALARLGASVMAGAPR